MQEQRLIQRIQYACAKEIRHKGNTFLPFPEVFVTFVAAMLKWLAELLQATPRGKRNQESPSSPYRHKGVQLYRVISTA